MAKEDYVFPSISELARTLGVSTKVVRNLFCTTKNRTTLSNEQLKEVLNTLKQQYQAAYEEVSKYLDSDRELKSYHVVVVDNKDDVQTFDVVAGGIDEVRAYVASKKIKDTKQVDIILKNEV